MKIAITGHRPNKLGNDYDLTSPLIQFIKTEIKIILAKHLHANYNTLITGMALGIDTLFALIAIDMNIPFIAAIPCREQWIRWAPKSVDLYSKILLNDLCTTHFVSRENYTHDCMQKRNEWMVDQCDLLIVVWDGTAGGTANCINYAIEKEKEFIRINPKDFRPKPDF